MSFKDEVSYRLEEVKYYILVAWDKFMELPSLIKIISGVLVAALVGSAAFGIISGDKTNTNETKEEQTVQKPIDNSFAEVPDLKFVKRSEALIKLKDLGFYNIDAKQIPEIGDSSVEEVIIEQIPAAGTSITKGEKITLRYGSQDLFNKQSAKKKIPQVKGVLLAKGVEQLKKNGFTNLSYNVPNNKSLREFVVTSTNPPANSVASLNTKITIAFVPGMDIKLFTDALKVKYIPYAKFAKITNPRARVVDIVLKEKDPRLITQDKINEEARVFKVGMEQVVGESLDQVILHNPGVSLKGDSEEALRNVTSNGLTIEVAQSTCEKAASDNFSDVEIDWQSNTIGQEVGAGFISLTVTARVTNEDEVSQDVVIKCKVTGTVEQPNLESFSAN